jgi:hypothetical protein
MLTVSVVAGRYADVHYYFSTPSILPRQHRFDKDSYLYVYHDPAQQTSRIEIANNPGTAELDAVCGCKLGSQDQVVPYASADHLACH